MRAGRDVAERPDSTVVFLVFAENRGGVAVEHGSVGELNLVAPDVVGMRVQIGNRPRERLGILDHAHDPLPLLMVVVVLRDVPGHVEQAAQPLVLKDLRSLFVDHQDAVDGGVHLGLEERGFLSQRLRRTLALRDVLNLSDEVARLTTAAPDERHAQQNRDKVSTRVNVPLLHLVGVDLPGDHPAAMVEIALDVLRIRDVRERASDQLGVGVAEQVAESLVDLEESALG